MPEIASPMTRAASSLLRVLVPPRRNTSQIATVEQTIALTIESSHGPA
jgi:hypothetical protein